MTPYVGHRARKSSSTNCVLVKKQKGIRCPKVNLLKINANQYFKRMTTVAVIRKNGQSSFFGLVEVDGLRLISIKAHWQIRWLADGGHQAARPPLGTVAWHDCLRQSQLTYSSWCCYWYATIIECIYFLKTYKHHFPSLQRKFTGPGKPLLRHQSGPKLARRVWVKNMTLRYATSYNHTYHNSHQPTIYSLLVKKNTENISSKTHLLINPLPWEKD